MSYPPPQGPWPPYGYGPPYYSYEPVRQEYQEYEEPPPIDNRSMIVLVAVGLPLLLLCAFGAMFFVLTDDGRPQAPGTVETQVVEDSPPADIQLDLSPATDPPAS